MIRRFIVFFIIFTGVIPHAFATQQQNLDHLKQTAQNFLEEQAAIESRHFKVRIGKIDPQLKLTPCPASAIEPFIPFGQTVTQARSIGLKCHAEGGWQVYIPSQVDIYAPVVITKQHLPRGHRIMPSDLTSKVMNTRLLSRGYYSDVEPLIGREVKRSIRAGSTLQSHLLLENYVIKKGDRVEIHAKINQIKVKSTGIAMNHAVKGDQVRIKSLANQKVIIGKAISYGTAEVSL